MNNKSQAYNIKEERDLELENIVGNLMIAQYQVDKLRARLSERVGRYNSVNNKKSSMHVFKHNDRWYKVTTKVEEVSLDSNNVIKP
ncbi:MAG TPA: hypothetical protein VE619_08290 [Nitrososphaeraceae archaeon]|nr:hypothetical protein [Nitrososphaeraceae archaeon]